MLIFLLCKHQFIFWEAKMASWKTFRQSNLFCLQDNNFVCQEQVVIIYHWWLQVCLAGNMDSHCVCFIHVSLSFLPAMWKYQCYRNVALAVRPLWFSASPLSCQDKCEYLYCHMKSLDLREKTFCVSEWTVIQSCGFSIYASLYSVFHTLCFKLSCE